MKSKSKMSNKEIVPPKPKAKFPEGKKTKGKDKTEIAPPHVKANAYGGKDDKETEEQKVMGRIPSRAPSTFRNTMRQLKKEYPG